jgi:hypothetical protein
MLGRDGRPFRRVGLPLQGGEVGPKPSCPRGILQEVEGEQPGLGIGGELRGLLLEQGILGEESLQGNPAISATAFES